MKYILIYTLLCLSLSRSSFGQGLDSLDRKAIAMADTSNFSPNASGHWLLYNSYLRAINRDSVVIELIIRHDKSINWSVYQFVGKIRRKELLPARQQEIPFSLQSDGYSLKIDENGKCYVRLVTGQLPQQDPVILPFRVLYRKT